MAKAHRHTFRLKIRRWRGGLLGLLAVLFGGPALAAAPPPSPWLEDLQQFREALRTRYANLEWAARDRAFPFDDSFRAAEAYLRQGATEAEARQLFDAFLRRLGDGHATIQWPRSAPGGGASASAPADPCRAMGYAARDDDGGVGPALDGARPLAAAEPSFFGASLVRRGGQAVAVIRIPSFSYRDFPAACRAALAAMSFPADRPCDEICREAVDAEVRRQFTQSFARQLRAARAAGAALLVIDLTGNGGGNDWVEAAMRMVTPVRLASPRVEVIRHPHSVDGFEQRLKEVAEISRTANAADLSVLRAYEAALVRGRDAARTPCDGDPLLRGQAPSCDLLVDADLHSSGFLASADPEWVRRTPWAELVFSPARYPYEEGVWRGPLAVLVDGRTASAAELFAAALQDNRAALVVGAPTLGAGCGYIDGGVTTTLAHTGGRLRLPDCARFRADGVNEVAGVDPDLLIAFRNNHSTAQRATRFDRALPQVIAAAARASPPP